MGLITTLFQIAGRDFVFPSETFDWDLWAVGFICGLWWIKSFQVMIRSGTTNEQQCFMIHVFSTFSVI